MSALIVFCFEQLGACHFFIRLIFIYMQLSYFCMQHTIFTYNWFISTAFVSSTICPQCYLLFHIGDLWLSTIFCTILCIVILFFCRMQPSTREGSDCRQSSTHLFFSAINYNQLTEETIVSMIDVCSFLVLKLLCRLLIIGLHNMQTTMF